MFYRTFILLSFGVNLVLAQRNIHERWEVQLDQYVAPTGEINYHDWKKEEHALYSYIQALQNHPPQPYWTKSNHKAYWINVYNATTIALILKHYPLQSIKEINTPWKAKVFVLKKSPLSLKAIEDILRQFNDPLILFALHRATVSGPQLSKKAYRGNTLEYQLQSAATIFLNDPNQNQCQEDTPRLSRIFLWFIKDFGSFDKKLTLIQKYGCTGFDKKTKLLYLPFDWGLNVWQR